MTNDNMTPITNLHAHLHLAWLTQIRHLYHAFWDTNI